MSNDFRGRESRLTGESILKMPSPAHPNDATKLTLRCRAGCLEFKLQLVCQQERTLKVEL
jgi:hypothetical protein